MACTSSGIWQSLTKVETLDIQRGEVFFGPPSPWWLTILVRSYTQGPIYSQLHVFGVWGKSGAPGENPRGHRRNKRANSVQTAPVVRIERGSLALWGSNVTAAPLLRQLLGIIWGNAQCCLPEVLTRSSVAPALTDMLSQLLCLGWGLGTEGHPNPSNRWLY